MEFWILFITFGILFLGELGEKTQLIVFNLALEYDKAYKVGVGATLGFAVIVSIGVLFGVVITKFIPLSIITIVSGIVFVIIGLLDARNLKELYLKRKEFKANKKSNNSKNNIEVDVGIESPKKLTKIRKNPYLAGFLFIFLMELGDKTQILTITLSSIYPHTFEVWLGSFLALISLAWMGVFIGTVIAHKIPKFHLKLISVSIFVFIGVFILITV